LGLLIGVLGAVLSALAWTGVVNFGQLALLQNLIAPATGVDFQGWLEEFRKSQSEAILIALVLAVLWHAAASRSSGRHSDRRVWWMIAWALCILCSVLLCIFKLPDTQEGVVWAYVLAWLNGMIPFWLGTVWCTPGACKYAPLGAMKMRGVFGL
jgi:hypothetical protein